MIETETPNILIFGNANIDLVLGEVDGWPAIGTEVQMQRSEMRAGGSAGNSSLALSGLGVAHRYISTIGKDTNGQWLKSEFESRYCDWIDVAIDTTLTVGIVHKGGDRCFFTTPGHLLEAEIDPLLSRIPVALEHVSIALISGQYLMPKLCEKSEILMQTLKSKGWIVAIDPGWPPEGWNDNATSVMTQWLQQADIALLNEDEVCGYTKQCLLDSGIEAIRSLMDSQACLVVKMGKQGAKALVDHHEYSFPAPHVNVIDTVGAGDTFNAAFIAALVAGDSVESALQNGVRVAAKVISTYPRRYQ